MSNAPITQLSDAELNSLRVRRDRTEGQYNWPSSADELLRAYETGERNFRGAAVPDDSDLAGAHFPGATLTMTKFIRANLTSANLDGADLEGAWLRRANLDTTSFTEANLSCAILDNTYAPGTWFQKATCVRTHFAGAYLRGAHFKFADLRHADLHSADLSEAQLVEADLRGAILIHANLLYANLDGANVLNAPGIYSAYASSLSSRGDSLFGSLISNGKEIGLRLWAGCKMGIPPNALRQHVVRTYGSGDSETPKARQYEAAITYIETAFAIDMEAHRWDYLLTWNEDRPTRSQEQV